MHGTEVCGIEIIGFLIHTFNVNLRESFEICNFWTTFQLVYKASDFLQYRIRSDKGRSIKVIFGNNH